MTATQQRHYDRQIANWLVFCAVVIFGMIVLGGVTRLTHSGLSMVEWKPLVGAIPPLSEAAWLESFDKYKQFPEYQKVNKGMSLAGYKSIFMYEYLHRLLGRLIGLLFFFPFVYFAFKGRIRPGLMPKLLVMFVMGALQGLLGWYMVKSGLVNDPRVSQYRLTAHLGVAVLIYGYMLWVSLDLYSPRPGVTSAPMRRLASASLALAVLIYFMILSGGLVAGTRAGLAYNTWPLMGTSFIPPGLYGESPMWRSIFEDITTIQFNHRMFAYLLVALIGVFAMRLYRNPAAHEARAGTVFLLLALSAQVLLGISTLLMKVPVTLGATHQAGAVILFTAALYVSHRTRLY